MKVFLFSFLAFTGVTSFASQLPNPVLRLHRDNGSVAPLYQEKFDCRIYESGLTLSYTNGNGLRLSQRRDLVLTGVKELLEIALNEPLTDVGPNPPPVGGGSEDFVAVRTVGAGAPDEFLLSTSAQLREGPASTALIRLLNLLCKF